MHEVQCRKLYKRCEPCGKPVLKSEYDQHIANKCQDLEDQPKVEEAVVVPTPVMPSNQPNYALPGTISDPDAAKK